jgi:hypothetical protein
MCLYTLPYAWSVISYCCRIAEGAWHVPQYIEPAECRRRRKKYLDQRKMAKRGAAYLAEMATRGAACLTAKSHRMMLSFSYACASYVRILSWP